MTRKRLDERHAALEDDYAARTNGHDLAAIRHAKQQDQRRQSAAQRIAAARAAVAARLLNLGISDDMIGAVELLPLFKVAWSDGTLTVFERETLLAAAAEAGIPADSSAHRLIKS